MLPGFNHNIRYRDRLFHVQTEDNGLQQPVLVTQVFIGGHVLAVERSKYDDLISVADEGARSEALKQRMQEQHKRLLKRLVGGELDDRVQDYLDNEAPESDALSEIDQQLPSAIWKAAEALPVAPLNWPDAAAPKPGGPRARTSVLQSESVAPPIMDDGVFDEMMGSLEKWEAPTTGSSPAPVPPPRPTPTQPSPPPPQASADRTLFGPTSSPAHRRPSASVPTRRDPPVAPSVLNEANASSEPSEGPVRGRPSRLGVRVGPAGPGSGSPPPGSVPSQDTLVDVQLPDAIRAAQHRLRSPGARSGPASSSAAPSLRRVEVHDARQQDVKRPAPLRPTRRNIPSHDQTMLEMDPTALREALAKQRALLEAQRSEKKGNPQQRSARPTKADEHRIVVSEPSLDEVIMSYLKDEE